MKAEEKAKESLRVEIKKQWEFANRVVIIPDKLYCFTCNHVSHHICPECRNTLIIPIPLSEIL